MNECKHVWYFADHNAFQIVDNSDHWYWHDFCNQVPYIIYLGEL